MFILNNLSPPVPGLIDRAHAAVQEVARTLGGEHAEKGGAMHAFYIPPRVEKPTHEDLLPLHAGWMGGMSNFGKLPKYYLLSIEKAMRLANDIVEEDHVSSWESRDEKRKLYGGAIRVFGTVRQVSNLPVQIILSFSGLTEAGDEAAMVLTALRMREWDIRQICFENILDESDNEIARQHLQSAASA